MAETTTTEYRRPAHVPQSLYWDHKLNDFTSELDDPYIAASRLHEGPGIIWAREASLGKPGWVLTRYALIRDAFQDWEHFSSTRDSSTGDVLGDVMRMIPVEVDPPEHHHYRLLLNPLFSPKYVRNYEVMVRETCDALVDKLPASGECEFIGEFAEVFPNSVFLSLVGLPQEELQKFLVWERQLLRAGDEADFEATTEAAGNIFRYLHGFLTKMRAGAERTDFVDALINGEIDGRPMNDMEILGTLFLFYIAGLDTVYSTLGWIMRHLALDPVLQDHLRNHPAEIPAAIEEFTRAYGVPAPHRRVTSDFEFHGVQMLKDDVVLLPTYLASRDPREYENPHRIDLTRRSRSVSFGSGPHTCLGIHLARREMRTVLEVFLQRYRSIRIPEGAQYEYHTGGVLGVDKLPLVLER